MARTTITMPDGLVDTAHKYGICVSRVAADAVKSEIEWKVERMKKMDLYREGK